MRSSSHKNLGELCRACLRTLKDNDLYKSECNSFNNDDCDSETRSFNSLVLPNLCKLFMLITAYDITKEYDDFPKRLCEWCYRRLLDYDDFRKLAVRSTEKLYKTWNASEGERFQIEGDSKETNQYDIKHDDNDDNQLLLPELVDIQYIKTEQAFEATDTQLILPSYLVESDFNRDTEEDADDEELLLSNGAANNSSPSISSQENKVVLTKKDRDRKSLHCNTCNKQFYKQVYLDAHIRGAHMGQEKPFQCSNCSKAFTRYNQLFLHIKSKHIEMLFRCDYENCNASFAVDIKLKLHRRVAHHSSEEVIPQNCQEEKEHKKLESEINNVCYLCTRKCSTKRSLKDHIKRHKKIKEHVCPECGVAKVTRTELVTHMRTHTPNIEKFPCPQCEQVFNHKNAISRHVKVVHEGLRRFTCNYCPRRFGTRNSQMSHERLHTGERPFACKFCRRGFAQPEGLRSHLKYHDKNLRKHICKYCSQRFVTLKNLSDHERRHFGDKPYICNICNKGFHSDAELKTHSNTHPKGAEDGVE